MPEKSGKLTESELRRAREWLDSRAPSVGQCSVCSTNKWSLLDRLVATPVFNRSLMLGGTTYPFVMLVCTNCAHTLFFNAVIAKILDDEQEQGTENPEQEKSEAEQRSDV